MTEVKYDIGGGKEIIAEYDENGIMEITRECFEALIEKQIPKKPKYVEVERDTMDMETGEEYTYKIDEAHCSCCDFIIGADSDIFDECYCSNCGQKIDFGSDENDRAD